MQRLIISTLVAIGLAAGILSGPAVAQQQDLQRIVALVNDEVISMRDLTERTQVIMVTGNLPDTPEVRRAVRDQAMRSLIDERLEMQEAKKRGISITQGDVDSAIARLEEQNRGVPQAGLDRRHSAAHRGHGAFASAEWIVIRASSKARIPAKRKPLFEVPLMWWPPATK